MLKMSVVLIMENFSLAFYDIIDLTPGSNSDFIRTLPIDAMNDMKRFGPEQHLSVTDDVKELIVKFIKVYMVYSSFYYIYNQIHWLFAIIA